MKIEVSLFGAFRDHEPTAQVALELPDDARVGDVRTALERHALAHWPRFQPGLLHSSALASDRAVLRDRDPAPADGRMALLPPVSGG